MEQWLPERYIEGESETLTIRGPGDVYIEKHQLRRFISTNGRLLPKRSPLRAQRSVQHTPDSLVGVQLLHQMVGVNIVKIYYARHVLVLRAVLDVAENCDELTIGRPRCICEARDDDLLGER